MGNRTGRYTIQLENKPSILGCGSVAGEKEGQGPIGERFDRVYKDDTLGQKSWEKAEGKMQAEALGYALSKSGKAKEDIDVVFAGDLLNQCVSSSYGLMEYNLPFLGLYGACSTMAQALALAAIFVDAGCAGLAAASTSSHFCAAERQYRFPLEYGAQRTPSSQWTVTGAGAAVIGGNQPGRPYVSRVCFGKITDLGVTDINNMGAAMAPAAAETIMAFLKDTNTSVSDYDLITTGDLGSVGSSLLRTLLEQEGVNVGTKLADCGELIFSRELQQVHAGGSGAGCSAVVICSYILDKLTDGSLQKVLFVGTGALMSPTSVQQGENIPGIAHLVEFGRC